MKEYNIKRQYCTEHLAKFDGLEVKLRFDKIEHFKKSFSVQEVFNVSSGLVLQFPGGEELLYSLSYSQEISKPG